MNSQADLKGLPGLSDGERERLWSLMEYERQAQLLGFRAIAGLDEAGRGPLAGPVFAAACILPDDCFFPGINDSKQLTALQRELLFEQITATPGLVYSVARVEHDEIDRINILQATIQAMLRAVAGLSKSPDYLLVDGLQLPHPSIPVRKIIGGDGLSQSIAAASILAKVSRDRVMVQYHKTWPQYGFDRHKGYGTEAHCAAIAEHGPCPIHRRSFKADGRGRSS